jgi:hypothetical protein
MKNPILLAALAGLLMVGCGTPNVNPTHAKANTGYVDFFTDADLGLCWEVKRASEGSGEMTTVFSEYKPVEGTILRLASPPGSHEFEVWFSNEVTQGPRKVSVLVLDGKVTPVHVTLTPSGTNFTQSKVYGFRASAKGYGHGTKIVTGQNQVYQIAAVAEVPQAYQPKERMPYFAPASK